MPTSEHVEDISRTSARKDEGPLLGTRGFKRAFTSNGEGDAACD